MSKAIHVLMVEDDPSDAELIKDSLRRNGAAFRFECVETRQAFVQALERGAPDVILSDYTLPSFDGQTALILAREIHPETPFIFVTGTIGEERAIETLKNGATDCVLKHGLSRLASSVHRALREAAERAERKRAVEQLRQSHEQLRALSVYLQRVREEERIRISRAVHDELGQALTGLKIDIAWLSSRLPQQKGPLLRRTREMSAHIDETIRTVRRISTELRPDILDQLGLADAIEWQANEFQTRTGIECRFAQTLDQAVFDEELNTAFFRIFQETLTNVVRHACATRVDVDLYEEEGRLVLVVRDDGRGITAAQLTDMNSIGLLGMRERAALLGGCVDITGAPRRGTRVTVSIPYFATQRINEPSHENTNRRRPRSGASWVETNPRR